jgi:hypothetical protein
VAHTCSIWEVEIRKIEVQDQPGQIVQEILWTAARVQVVEHLLWKCKALNQTPIPPKTKPNQNKKTAKH